MLGEIRQYTHEQFVSILNRPWRRQVDQIHVHHTWRPRHADWHGEATVRAMRDYHVGKKGWSDIAQHLTIGPDGSLWGGRHLDRPPASAAGRNGDAHRGPLMIEMVGNFDEGENPFASESLANPDSPTRQARAAYQAVAAICAEFGLHADSVFFHRDFTGSKSCPGTGIRREDFRRAVADELGRLAPSVGRARAPAAAARGDGAAARYLRQFDNAAAHDAAADDGEPDCAGEPGSPAATRPTAGRGLFDAPLAENDLALFRQHVVNLEMGRLSDSGEFTTSRQDLEALLANLEAWIAGRPGQPAHVLFYAHGGLNDEGTALRRIVRRDLSWWLANGVYPIFFVWETGINEVFGKLRQHDEKDGERNLLRKAGDAALEATFGPLLGRPTWRRIKNNAHLSCNDIPAEGAGGAAVFAGMFARAQAAWSGSVQLHAIGHSAGAILHCHFLPALRAAQQRQAAEHGGDVPAQLLGTLTLLAPAARVDLFKHTLLPLLRQATSATGGAQVRTLGRLALFTMHRQAEEADNVIALYGKSLLYFVRNACEDGGRPPILGLQESIEADAEVAALFGLGATGQAIADVIWSPTTTDTGRNACQATAHGAFDDDPACMNAVLRRILGLDDVTPLALPNLGAPMRQRQDETVPSKTFADVVGMRGGTPPAAGGRRLALCIGINDYPDAPLHGCVADAGAWSGWLAGEGFDVRSLVDAQATKKAITGAIESMLATAAAGDVAVMVFAGHGTQLDDVSGDESDRLDEAWVPHDYRDGEFLLDDELGALLDRYRGRSIEVVLFTDCCHSGSSTRAQFAAGSPQLGPTSRFMRVPQPVRERFRAKQRSRDLRIRKGDSVGWEIHFAACQDDQSAYESDGNGRFTVAALAELSGGERSALTYGSLADRLRLVFDSDRNQTPSLRAVPDSRRRRLWNAAARAAAQAEAPADLSQIPNWMRHTGCCERVTTQLGAIVRRLDGMAAGA